MPESEISPESAKKEKNREPFNKYPRYADTVKSARKHDFSYFYPDGSRYFDDLVSMVRFCTAEGSPIMIVHGGLLFHQRAGGVQIYFEDGYLTPLHKHNFIELAYVIEGQFHKKIEGKNYVFNQGEFFLLNRAVSHGEYYYQKKSTVAWLRLSNSFFDKTISHHDIMPADQKSDEFIQRFVLNKNREYCFVLFTPGQQEEAPCLFKQIIDELEHPRSGSIHIVIGYIKRLLSLLPLDYSISVEWKTSKAANNFEEICHFLEERYKDVSMDDLISVFGHNIDYFNRLIKRNTGNTYTVFIQDIRLEKAKFLLKTTDLTIKKLPAWWDIKI